MVPMPFWKSVVRFNVCIAEYPMFRCACVHGVSASDIVLRRVKKPVGKKFIRRNADASTNVEKMHVVSLGYQLESFLFYKRERERKTTQSRSFHCFTAIICSRAEFQCVICTVSTALRLPTPTLQSHVKYSSSVDM